MYICVKYTENMYTNICKRIVDLSKKQLQKEQTHHLYYRAKLKLQSKKLFLSHNSERLLIKLIIWAWELKTANRDFFIRTFIFLVSDRE